MHLCHQRAVDQSTTKGEGITGGETCTASERQSSRAYPIDFPRVFGQEGRQAPGGTYWGVGLTCRPSVGVIDTDPVELSYMLGTHSTTVQKQSAADYEARQR